MWLAGALVAAACAAALVRRPAVPRLTLVMAGIGGLLLATAAGGPAWHRPEGGEALVMVDLSPSTRGAGYRDAAALHARVRQLLGGRRYRVLGFSGPGGVRELPGGGDSPSTLPDFPADQTTFSPPSAPAVLLFSDARFDPPSVVPPAYVVVDPLLESPVDGAVERLEARGGEVLITTRNSGDGRELVVSGTKGPSPLAAPPGPFVVAQPLGGRDDASSVVARLSDGDVWPENDALSLSVPPAAETQRWWVAGQRAGSPPGATWRPISPKELPTDAAAYLAPAVIVLDNVAASELTATQTRRLRQYVADAGGGLLLLGGDGAFAAGGYVGTDLESLSPLASTPPQPAAHWVLLVDSSGSMNAAAGGAGGGSGTRGTRWRAAVDAAAGLVGFVPPDDLLSVGGFAADVTWWVRGRRAADASGLALPPAGAGPSGPTELRRALEAVTAAADGPLPTQIVLLTDANAELSDVDALAEAMRRKNVRLHLLAIGEAGAGAGAGPGGGTAGASGLAALRRLVADTAGTLVEQRDPARWAESARLVLRRAAPRRFQTTPLTIQFLNEMEAVPPREVAPWNRTWLKGGATLLGDAGLAEGGRAPLVARWATGEGSVGAAAFGGPGAQELDALAGLVARPPRDPRLRVTWDTGPRLRVSVDAADGDAYLNGLDLSLQLADSSSRDGPSVSHRVPQTGPGRYGLTLDPPRSPAFATLRHDGRAVDRVAIAGRYAPEFDSVGNDRGAMRDLAARSGGSVVEPSVNTPLDFPRPRRDVPITPPLAASGAACLALALISWKLGRA